ncbi:MAG: hypothetical protein M5U27_01935 [Gaiella sp.]|nr:hypothetical protein [Gaiella sp.]
MSPTRRFLLKALLTGLCALVLLVTPAAAQARSSAELGAQLARHVAAMKKSTSVIRFFDTHRWLLSDPRFEKEAALRLGIARRTLAASRATAARARAELARRREAAEQRRQLASLARSPRKAICHVFGSYCGQALRVARCESGYSVNARNGQYRGLFQMGSSERQIFGHGAGALEQAQAAYRYFVRSGRDWSPWSCKPWY